VEVQCCFCGKELFEDEPGLVTLVIAAVPRSSTAQPRAQQMWCHARCLGTRLHKTAVFDADRFDVADAATVKEEARREGIALARAADDGWPTRDDEQYGLR